MSAPRFLATALAVPALLAVGCGPSAVPHAGSPTSFAQRADTSTPTPLSAGSLDAYVSMVNTGVESLNPSNAPMVVCVGDGSNCLDTLKQMDSAAGTFAADVQHATPPDCAVHLDQNLSSDLATYKNALDTLVQAIDDHDDSLFSAGQTQLETASNDLSSVVDQIDQLSCAQATES